MNRPQVSPLDRLVVRLVHAQRQRFGRLATLALQVLGVHISRDVTVGSDLLLPHASAGSVVHYRTVIGDRVTIFHNVTVGRADAYAPTRDEIPGAVIEDDVVLCAGAVVLPGPDEPLVIGHGAVVGANAVVTRSVPAGEVWAGNPARKVSAR